MSKCRTCDSTRIFEVQGKTSDRCFTMVPGGEEDGYVPDDIGVGGGDYLKVIYCADCGQLQGGWPLPKCELEGVDRD